MDPQCFHSHAHPHPHQHAHSHAPPQQHSEPETVFRLLCPSSKAGGVIGKGGAVIRQLREETGARIRVIDDSTDERFILIAAPNFDDSVAQSALIRVFERVLKVDEEENGRASENGELGFVVCRLLTPSSQVGSVLGRGGRIIEKIRHDSGARVRVLPRENLPPCAYPDDELIQISGNYQSVKNALLAVSSCLQDREDMFNGPNLPSLVDSFPQKGLHASNHHCRGFSMMSMPEKFGPDHGMAPEEEVVFRLLCQADKIGSLIGKGGCIIRGIENKTGATIKIGDAVAPRSDERVVVILAREYFDVKRSSAQDAVIRVHSRITEIGFESGAAVIARLLVHSQQIGCLLGKGGHIITEMRRHTGASIRIFGREQSLKLSNPNDEVVQVSGSLQCVHDALFQITSRLREMVFHPRSLFPEFSSPSFRPRYDQDLPHGYDNHSVGHRQACPFVIAHGVDGITGANEQQPYHYVGNGASYGPPFERPPSPRAGYSQAVNNENPTGYSDTRPGPSGRNVINNESGQIPMTTSVEVSVPQILLPYVYGENKSNLGHITQFSGADVIVHDPNRGVAEGLVVISGTPSQCHTAQSLVHAFILSGQAF